MKTFTKFTIIAAALAAFASSGALAHERYMGQRLAWHWVHGQYTPLYVPDTPKTIAVYAGRTGMSDRTMMDRETPRSRFVFRFNAHGDRTGFYVFDK